MSSSTGRVSTCAVCLSSRIGRGKLKRFIQLPQLEMEMDLSDGWRI